MASAPAPQSPQDTYIETWDQYWLEMAVTASRKSKDPRCRVGAVIVRDNIVLSTGFNGFAREVFDDPALLNDQDEKLRLICHAEQNAIHNATRLGFALAGAAIYVTKFPCLACCNAIIQSGIRVVHTHDTKYWDDDPADRDHSRKKSALRQARIDVDAPFHPDYLPKRVTTSKVPTLVSAPPPPKRKGKKKMVRSSAEQRPLFGPRNAIRSGKSG